MVKKIKTKVRRKLSSNRRQFIIVVGITTIGIILFVAAKAQLPIISLEAENGSRTAAAETFSNGQASNNSSVRFTTAGLPNCPYTAPVPANKWGGMTYVNYNFNQNDIFQIAHEVDVINSPATNSNHYIQLYDGDIGASGQYYGLQTTGLVIWSRWNTSDLSNVRAAAGSTAINDVELGAQFISLRRQYPSLPSGHYKTRIVRAEFDGLGDWFKYYVTFPGQAEDYIGDIRFPRKVAGTPASFADNGGQWNEFWPNNGSSLLPVPLLRINVKATANNGLPAVSARGHYSPMPNSDMYVWDAATRRVRHEIGGTVGRCHPGDANGNLQLW